MEIQEERTCGGCCTCAYPLGERMLVEGGEGVDGVLLEPSSLSKRDETFVERLNFGIRRKAFKRVMKDKRQLGLLSLK